VSTRLALLLARAWRAVRVLTGDAAYEIYLARAGETPLSREAFYLDRLQRRYRGPNRCC
jgi:uncharacterized short protein YbdD (DUF466 family)